MIEEVTLGFILFILGLISGSFVNAWVWRTRKDISVAKGHSICPRCKHALAWFDLIPLFSYIALKGKCRYCHKEISLQYPIVELCTGVLFVVLYLTLNPNTTYNMVQFVILLVLSVLLVAALVYDAKYMELPEKFMLPAIVLGVLSLGLKAYQNGWNSLTDQLIGLAVVVLLYTALWFFSKGKWLGAGDIRIVAVMGLLLIPSQLIVGLFITYLVGAVYGLYVLSKTKNKKGIKVPFGPFLILGLYVGLLWGGQIANWYLSFLQPT
jgi:prepilin signal peptidase PulO-like enzyme (type II secretory pathway)